MADPEVRISKRLRLHIRRARLLLLSGDRAGAMAMLNALEGLSVDGSATLDSIFRCDRLHIERLRIKDCLIRRSRVWPSGGGRGSPAPQALGCVGCPVGQAFATRFSEFKPPPSNFPLSNAPYAVRARRKEIESSLMRRMEDPLRIAAGMTPDDHNDWRA